MACPVITIDAQFTEFNDPSGLDLSVALVIEESYTDLNTELLFNSQVFNSNNTAIHTGFIANGVLNDATIIISLINENGDLCEYEETFTADQEIGQDIDREEVYYRTFFQTAGTQIIEGCTDPLAENYNPNANVSTDTCIYPDEEDEPNNDDGDGGGDENDIFLPVTTNYVEGCTNPLAINYNPNANINDGSCFFVSGCTLELAENYNPNAVIDDGSCDCNSYNLLLDFSGSTGGYFIPLSSGSCTTVLSFDYVLELTCEDILDIYLENTGQTLTNILDSFELFFKAYDEDYKEVYSKKIWQHNFSNDKIDLYLKEDAFCETFFEILQSENNLSCDAPIENKYKPFRSKQEFIIPNLSGKNILFTLQLKNISTDHCLILDNIKLTQFCEIETKECILIPKKYGFELEKEKDNEKTSLEPSSLTLNTKEITLRVNPIEYINNDINDYFNKKGYFIKEERLFKLSKKEIQDELIDVRNRQTVSTYIYYDFIYDNYINSQYSCALKSKELNYQYADEVYDLIDPIWYDLTDQFLPATAIRKGGHYFYKNLDVHQPKHEYKGYTIDRGCDGDANIDFQIITDDPCIEILTYKSKFEQIIQNNDLCDQCQSTGVTYSYFDDGNNESGRLVQYSGDSINNIVETVNFDTIDTQPCDEGCSAGVEITDTFTDGPLLFVQFLTTNVTSEDEITASYEGTLMDLAFYDESSGSGYFTLRDFAPPGNGDAVVTVNTSECGSASDTVFHESCFIAASFANLPYDPVTPVTYEFSVYGTIDPNEIVVIVNGASVPVTYVGNGVFSIEYIGNPNGNDFIEITATMDCARTQLTVINNPQ